MQLKPCLMRSPPGADRAGEALHEAVTEHWLCLRPPSVSLGRAQAVNLQLEILGLPQAFALSCRAARAPLEKGWVVIGTPGLLPP